MTSTDAASVVRTILDHLAAHDMTAFTATFADDALMEFPFAPADRPRALHGRAAVEEYLCDYADLLDVREVHDVTLHEATGGTVVVEFAVDGVVVATGAHYTARHVAVITVVDGRIHRYRDYWDPTAFADVPVGEAVTS